MSAPETKECLRCKKLGRKSVKPVSAFYKDRRGKPLPTCIECRKELSHKHYIDTKKLQRSKRDIPESGKIDISASLAARTLVVEPPSGPKFAVWRCMSCWAKAITRGRDHDAPPFPANWRNMQLEINGRGRGIILCSPCSTQLLKARRILARISERVAAEEKETDRRPAP